MRKTMKQQNKKVRKQLIKRTKTVSTKRKQFIKRRKTVNTKRKTNGGEGEGEEGQSEKGEGTQHYVRYEDYEFTHEHLTDFFSKMSFGNNNLTEEQKGALGNIGSVDINDIFMALYPGVFKTSLGGFVERFNNLDLKKRKIIFYAGLFNTICREKLDLNEADRITIMRLSTKFKSKIVDIEKFLYPTGYLSSQLIDSKISFADVKTTIDRFKKYVDENEKDENETSLTKISW